MKAKEINTRFLDLAPWLDRGKSVDRVIAGDPEKDIRFCMVTWISSMMACKTAIERGADMLITHEPTFYEHWDKSQTEEASLTKAKRRFINDSGLVILRIHDVWDCYPELGIPWAWARFIGMGPKPVSGTDAPAARETTVQGIQRPSTMFRYDIDPTTAGELAHRVASRTADLGEPKVQFIGEENAIVSKIGIGTGCLCWPASFMELGCDCSVVCDDGTSYWRSLQYAEDAGHPVIRVNHGTAEEPGMMTMAKYINDNMPGVRAEYLPHRPAFRVVG
ncbi:MAG: hypothetical protein C0404_10265 [Verrucomicrobia bacterium]|nr:hypothetical protein [Verrucomicrobiota bacterium]